MNDKDQWDPRLILRAFRYRNYRLFFAGQGISVTGSWMQTIAMSWLVYRLTDSPFLLGLVGFTSRIPSFILSPVAGALADRWNRLKMIIVLQILSMFQALLLGISVLANFVNIWYIISLSLFLGIVSAFEIPTRQSFIIHLVDKREDLGNAIALNSFMFNSARMIGPSLAGVIINAVGEGLCFLINALSYLAVVFALFAIKVNLTKNNAKTSIFREVSDGFKYVFGSFEIKYILILLGIVSLVGMPYAVLMPVFARDIFKGGPNTLGFLMASAGSGALLGALFLASKRSPKGLIRVIPIATCIFGLGLITFSRCRNLWLSLVLISISGFGMMVQTASSNTTLQMITDDDKRGRVMSFHSLAFMGTAPFGSLLAGSVANKIGAPDTLLLGGALCIVGAVFFIMKVRPFQTRSRRG